MQHYYTVNKTAELLQLIKKIDKQQETIDEKWPLQPERWKTIMEKLKMEWTYYSNAIEGNTLILENLN